MSTKKERMYQSIESHGNDLKRIFRVEMDSIALSKKVFSYENKAHRLAEHYCNGVIDTLEWETETEKILNKLDKILGFRALGIPIHVNGDARGYALKIDDKYIRDNKINIYRDFGGYGILAPDFREE